MSARDPDCPLCREDGGDLLWQGPHLRVIEVPDADYPGFTRVIWNAHIPEMTSLSTHGRELLMRAVYAVEQAQRDILAPDKVNLASLGNMARAAKPHPATAAALPQPTGRSHERLVVALNTRARRRLAHGGV